MSTAKAKAAERSQAAVLARADGLVSAYDYSLADTAHREHVLGILRGAAPTFCAAQERLISEARKARNAR
jgi:hypothetical protein